MTKDELLEMLRSFELYSVVCNDLDVALGPFNGYEFSTDVCMLMNAESTSGCNYTVVPFALVIDTKELEAILPGLTAGKPERGYL